MGEAVQPRRILLVEDDAELRDALAEALREQRHEVVAVQDGLEALREVRGWRPDVVVLDLMMPAMDGWEFRVEQRRDPIIADIPVVAMSANRGPVAAAIDADLYVPKPLDADTLAAAIDLVVENARRRAEQGRVAEGERLGAIRTMAAGVAHEVNNPLTYVLLHLTHGLRLLPELTNDRNRLAIEKLETVLHGALEGVHRIREITAGVGSFARSGPQTRTFLDVRPILDAALQLFMQDARRRARVVRGYQAVPLVLGNEGSLAQAFFHVLANAVLAIPPGNVDGNEIRVATRMDDAGDVIVEIADTGCGIAPHVRPHIFEPFFSTRPQGEGVGLGLSITHGVVHAHGGDVDVRTEVARGTTVAIRLPRAGAAPAPGEPSA